MAASQPVFLPPKVSIIAVMMKNSRIQQEALLDNLKNDLKALKIDIEALSTSLLPSPVKSIQPPISPASSVGTIVQKPQPSRLGRLASALAQMSNKKSAKGANIANRWNRGRYKTEAMDEVHRRGSNDSNTSADSDMTLVGSEGQGGPGGNAGGFQEDSAGELLATLAPVIAALQHLGIKLRTHTEMLRGNGDYTSVKDSFLAACESVVTLLLELESPNGHVEGQPDSLADVGQDNLEMRSLMLEALKKKVKTEQHRLSTASFASPQRSPTHDPFAVHSASSPYGRSRKGGVGVTKSVPIKISAVGGGQAGEVAYRSFMANSQQSAWAINAVRLGSFQASALFTPSPVAVRRLVGDSGKG
ncbi:hypothetical protein I350_01991 [Cryptococcus amylolentus CBS 6273]|uniref:Uncharacterized protein n=1 Tax=Cryptococcus amylolentus CBS 6273 TaxID=1296118 RepID=A0A1E3K9A7_9TREE|nr:hypothetical protein I350_01991 [Cryptococcus amylolentus CBS 6273]